MSKPGPRRSPAMSALVGIVIGIAVVIGLGYVVMACALAGLMGDDCGGGAGLVALAIVAGGVGLWWVIDRAMRR